ncbi:MAG: chemotaxis protein CheD [Sedimentisphaerales bacterium]|nr:chemotaxis protein CheD [Sedimentisphaerales bacterium]
MAFKRLATMDNVDSRNDKQAEIKNVPPGDMILSDKENCVLRSSSLGADIAVTFYHQESRTASMLHIEKPTAEMDSRQKTPYAFADSGVEQTLEQLTRRGIDQKKLKVSLAGGAYLPKSDNQVTDESDKYLGRWNYSAVRRALWRRGVLIDRQDVGGNRQRSLTLNVADGGVIITND